MSTDPKISLKGVVKRFGSKTVLNGIDLDVATGESVAIIGGSGSGKSVTLKCILGLMAPEAGSIKIDGKETVRMAAGERDRLMRQVGMLFQHAALFDSLTVWENVAFALRLDSSIDKEEARRRAIERLAQVGLGEEVCDINPAELSGGMRKRVGLARAIATEPAVIFFDEPTTGLDPIMGDIIDQLIVKCVKELGATALTITHDMDSARTIADRIAMIYEGKIVWAGPVSEIDHSGNAIVEQFIEGRVDGPIEIEGRKRALA
jgi:phospholipid/cholesterol/gamma-HCH transport system ATP-binding protein